MSRWHEHGCTRPDVVVCGGLPCCQFCYAIASTDDIQLGTSLPIPQAPVNRDNSSYNLRWPAGVEYLDRHPEPPSAEPCQEVVAIDDPIPKRRKLTSFVEKSHRTPSCYHPMLWGTKEIRMLILDSGPRDSLLHANFKKVSLGSEDATYEALSYTWADNSGDSVRRMPMFIGTCWDIIPITRNCEDALLSVRLKNGGYRSLWVDSLCINQEDDEERSAQVCLMPHIYANATRVLVYLGPAADDSDKALSAIFSTMTNPNCGHNGNVPEACNNCREPIKKLLNRPYFQRQWVVQEVLLSKEMMLYCGSKSTPWPHSRMLELLVQSHWAAARDKTALHPQRDLLSLMVNTLEEVSIGVAAYLMQRCGLGMMVLLFADANRARHSSLPSWVPDIQVPFGRRGSVGDLYDRFWNAEEIDEGDPQRSRWVRSTKTSFLSLIPITPGDIHIISQSAHLEVTAVKLCNVLDYFRKYGTIGRGHLSRQPGLGHYPKTSAMLWIPRSSSTVAQELDEIDIYQHMTEDDSLFWLHGINGFAILRPVHTSSTYRHICACDLIILEGADVPIEDLGFRPFMKPDYDELESKKRSLVEDLHLIVAGASVKQLSEVPAEDLMLKLATYVNRVELDLITPLWKTWKRFEMELKPYLETKKGIRLVIHGITHAKRLPLETDRDGRRHRQAFLYRKRMKSITALLLSILSQSSKTCDKTVGPEKNMVLGQEILDGFQDWADATSNLLFAMAHSAEYKEEALFGLKSCSEVHQEWSRSMDLFQRKVIAEGYTMGSLETVAYIFRLFPHKDQNNSLPLGSICLDGKLESRTEDHDRSHFTVHSLWNWDAHQWLSSWRDTPVGKLAGLEQQMAITIQ
ncbi:heterokaryon incompatibility protein [Colletotrichum simmondsii]|uniref:Heterokaryon incompatibility protein n=1 Tax=Colletotrichum simmondsii TaxID=703756 RepID=A0A135SDZ1_9PEZI|nr:heterokaryon incompatibility protein [Colletotrichum simmondsii]